MRRPVPFIDVRWTYDQDGRVYVAWEDMLLALKIAGEQGVSAAQFFAAVSRWRVPPDPGPGVPD